MTNKLILTSSKDNEWSKDKQWSKGRTWPKRSGKIFALGWMPDHPSIRDFHPSSDKIPNKLKARGQQNTLKELLQSTNASNIPTHIDLREYCSPIEDQGAIGSCTANAGVALLEYYEKRSTGKHIDASRLFLYKATRNLLGLLGDTGASLRSTMEAMVLFGVPPEEYWPYSDASPDFDEEPSAFCYAFGQNFQSINYYRLDPIGSSQKNLLKSVKYNLALERPSMFGFTVYSSYMQADDNGKIPFPTDHETVVGGHAVIAVGYDDKIVIENKNPGGCKTKGALLIRNSWGTEWGDGGYGWLPYEYLEQGLATDWWSLIKSEWKDTGVFI